MNESSSEGHGQDAGGEVGLVEYQDFHYDRPFQFASGQSLPGFTLRYETYGRLNASRTNAVLVCHALSGNHHCAGIHSMEDRKPGWWNTMIGPGKPIDTNRFFVICSNTLGGCSGSTGPRSLNPQTGQPYNMSFPEVSVADMVESQAHLLDHLGVERLACVTGGSMGGMQVLQWAVAKPGRVGSFLPLATTARQNVQAIAFNAVGRAAIQQDPAWQGGNYAKGEGPRVGLAIARMMAHITYLSDLGLDQKFRQDATGHNGAEFEVESYLRYQGSSFVSRFDANSYLYLTRALDLFNLYGEANDLRAGLESVRARSLTVAFSSDWLFPPEQNRAIAETLLQLGQPASYVEVEASFGHDSFLLKSEDLFRVVRGFMNSLSL